MKEKTNLARIYSLAEAYGKRPSEIVGLETPLGAFQFDEACLIVGRRVERNVNEGKAAFEGLSASAFPPQRGRYRSVKGTRPIRKMKIPKSGVW